MRSGGARGGLSVELVFLEVPQEGQEVTTKRPGISLLQPGPPGRPEHVGNRLERGWG